jgi:hypothetical protein
VSVGVTTVLIEWYEVQNLATGESEEFDCFERADTRLMKWRAERPDDSIRLIAVLEDA